MAVVSDLLRVGSGKSLADIDPGSTPGYRPKTNSKEQSRLRVAEIGTQLAAYQEILFANAKVTGDQRRVLLVLQAMDCGGKDGTVKNVVGQFDPLGLRIVSFGPPTKEEREHPFLWRISRDLPPPGYLGVFNRSHYEDVLVVRVRELVPKRVWAQRYSTINKFEADLADSGFTLVKVMLHISYAEQGRRLAERLTDPTKHWKYNPDDIDARERWEDYQEAYGAMLEKCSTEVAPWYVVPADRKWYRNWAVANLLLETFQKLDLQYPKTDLDLVTIVFDIGEPLSHRRDVRVSQAQLAQNLRPLDQILRSTTEELVERVLTGTNLDSHGNLMNMLDLTWEC